MVYSSRQMRGLLMVERHIPRVVSPVFSVLRSKQGNKLVTAIQSVNKGLLKVVLIIF
jgi:hypothetical protein